MQITNVTLLGLLAPSLSAGMDFSATGSQSSTPTTLQTSVPIHTVDVGINEQLLFSPPQLDARVGDVVVFQFHGSNHSVVESTLAKPCQRTQSGFVSGFGHFTPNEELDVVVLTVTDRAPRWFFCEQQVPESHCSHGMVFAINPGDQMNHFLNNAQGWLPITTTSTDLLNIEGSETVSCAESYSMTISGAIPASISDLSLLSSNVMQTSTTVPMVFSTPTSTYMPVTTWVSVAKSTHATMSEVTSANPDYTSTLSTDFLLPTTASSLASKPLVSWFGPVQSAATYSPAFLWVNGTIESAIPVQTTGNLSQSYVNRSASPVIVPVNKSVPRESSVAVWVMVRVYLVLSIIWIAYM